MSDLSIHQPNSYDIQIASQEAEPPSPTTSSKAEPSAAGAQAPTDDSAHLAHLAEAFSGAGSGTGEPSGPQTQPRPSLGNPAANQPAQAGRKAPEQGGSRPPGRAGRPKPPGLSLSAAALNPASLGPAVATGGGRPATEEAGNKIPTIQAQMGQLPPSTFSPGTNVPAYETFQNGSYKQSPDKPESPEIKNEDYHFHPDPQGFTEANRTSGPGSNSKFEGQKIHISVDPNDPKKAYDALAPLLFSPDSPIDRFKMTNMGEAQGAANDAATRVSQGAQFTLYLKPNQDGKFDAEHLKKIQSFVGEAETRLQQGGVGHGTVPNTDAALPGQGYASFRTEEAERTQQGAEKVKQDPVYQLLNHP